MREDHKCPYCEKIETEMYFLIQYTKYEICRLKLFNIFKLKNQSGSLKHYSMPPVVTQSKKLFLVSRSKSRSQGH